MRASSLARGLRDPARLKFFVAILALVLAAGLTALGCGGGGVEPGATLTISLAGAGNGTVTGNKGGINCTNTSGSPTGVCSADMGQGTEVTLSATAGAGSTFAGWSGGGVSCDASAPCTITVSSNLTVTATFNGGAATQTLTVAGAGSGSGHVVSDPGGIDCQITSGTADDTGCSASFDTGETVALQVTSGNLVAWGGDCTGATCSVSMTQARTVLATFGAESQPTQLGFVGQPSAVQKGNVISPPVQVAIQDANGQTVAGRTDAVTLQIGANPGQATLGGTLTKNAVNGVASFSDLTLNQSGADYTLVASAAQLTNANSAPFTVSDLPVGAHLAFAAQPSNTVAGVTMTPVTVEIRDQSNALLTSRIDVINIALGNNPTGATLNGNLSATAVAGVATFSNLMMTKAGTGYTLTASTGNASGATSNAFNINAGPAALMVPNAAGSRSAPAGTAVASGDRPSVKITDAFNNPVEGVSVDWNVTVDAGGGKVDPASRSTGPLGVSIVISWTLGQEVGTDNNELQASRAGLIGSPVTFKATGTIPPGKGVFTGTLKTISNTGVFGDPIADANLVFTTPPGGASAGTTKSRSDGSFTSPPLPAGSEFRIAASRAGLKTVTFQKPSLTAGAQFDLRTLGMVIGSNSDDGVAGLNFTVKLKDLPDKSVPVRVEIYKGYYVGESDMGPICGPDTETQCSPGTANILESSTVVGKDPQTETVVSNADSVASFFLGDWGVLTVRVRVTGYKSPDDRFIVVDSPTGFRWACDNPDRPKPSSDPPQCIDPYELDPTP